MPHNDALHSSVVSVLLLCLDQCSDVLPAQLSASQYAGLRLCDRTCEQDLDQSVSRDAEKTKAGVSRSTHEIVAVADSERHNHVALWEAGASVALERLVVCTEAATQCIARH